MVMQHIWRIIKFVIILGGLWRAYNFRPLCVFVFSNTLTQTVNSKKMENVIATFFHLFLFVTTKSRPSQPAKSKVLHDGWREGGDDEGDE